MRQAVIHQDEVAASDADVLDDLALRRRPQHRQTQRKRQGVFLRPGDLGQGEFGNERIVNVRDAGQPHGDGGASDRRPLDCRSSDR